MQVDFEVLRPEARNIHEQHIALLLFADVNGRQPILTARKRFSLRRAHHPSEQIERVSRSYRVAHRFQLQLDLEA